MFENDVLSYDGWNGLLKCLVRHADHRCRPCCCMHSHTHTAHTTSMQHRSMYDGVDICISVWWTTTAVAHDCTKCMWRRHRRRDRHRHRLQTGYILYLVFNGKRNGDRRLRARETDTRRDVYSAQCSVWYSMLCAHRRAHTDAHHVVALPGSNSIPNFFLHRSSLDSNINSKRNF